MSDHAIGIHTSIYRCRHCSEEVHYGFSTYRMSGKQFLKQVEMSDSYRPKVYTCTECREITVQDLVAVRPWKEIGDDL